MALANIKVLHTNSLQFEDIEIQIHVIWRIRLTLMNHLPLPFCSVMRLYLFPMPVKTNIVITVFWWHCNTLVTLCFSHLDDVPSLLNPMKEIGNLTFFVIHLSLEIYFYSTYHFEILLRKEIKNYFKMRIIKVKSQNDELF